MCVMQCGRHDHSRTRPRRCQHGPVNRHPQRNICTRIAPRSGLAVKHFIDTGAGVVDEDYRGTVGVVLFNHGEADYQGGSPWGLDGAVSHGSNLLISRPCHSAASCGARCSKGSDATCRQPGFMM